MRASRIAEERRRRGLTVAEVAAAIGTPEKAVENWERGEKEIPASGIVALAKLFGVSCDWLLGRV